MQPWNLGLVGSCPSQQPPVLDLSKENPAEIRVPHFTIFCIGHRDGVSGIAEEQDEAAKIVA